MPLYPILDTELLRRHQIPLLDAVRVALDFPLPWIQIRHKGHFDRVWLRDLESCAALPHQGRLILNDRADYARLYGLGLHVGQDDLPPAAARDLLGSQAVIGLSTHSAAQLQLAPYSHLTYVALGPIFSTSSKANPDPVVGVSQLAAWRKHAPCPLVAIGGLSLENAAAVQRAGADFLALISALWRPPYTLVGFGNEIETWLKTLADSKEASDSSTPPQS